MKEISVYVNVSIVKVMCCMTHVGYLAKTKLNAVKLRGFDLALPQIMVYLIEMNLTRCF